MRAALRAPAACVARFALSLPVPAVVLSAFIAAFLAVDFALIGPFSSRAAAADGDGRDRDATTVPLVLLVQGDALAASRPNLAADPRDAPGGPALRLRRVRVGEDVALGDYRLRALFEGAAETAAGTPFTPRAGGRLPFGGPVRVTEAHIAWARYRAFRIEAGSLRVPFSLSRQIDEGELRLPERAPFVDAFLPDYRLGAMLGGDLGELFYEAAVMSADPALDSHLFSRGVLVAGRVVAEPLGPVGLVPWRRPASDPWDGWFRFAAGLSVLYGTLAAPSTLAIDPEFSAQWRSLVVTAEYLFSVRCAHGTAIVPGSTAQGATLEPGVTLRDRRLDLTARGDWERQGATGVWGVGAGVTAYAPDPRWRLNAGFERRWTEPASPGGAGIAGGSYWAIIRLTVAVN